MPSGKQLLGLIIFVLTLEQAGEVVHAYECTWVFLAQDFLHQSERLSEHGFGLVVLAPNPEQEGEVIRAYKCTWVFLA